MLHLVAGMAGTAQKPPALLGGAAAGEEKGRACGLRDSLSQVCNRGNSAAPTPRSDNAAARSVITQGLAEWDTGFSGLFFRTFL